jgi:hypothetical protein
MALYGLRVLTQNGYKDFAEIFGTCRYVGRVTIPASSVSGSLATPAIWTRATGVFVISNMSPSGMPNVTVSDSTVSWTGNNYSKQLEILFFLTNQTAVPTGYGFYARNQSNVLVLDSNYKPLSLISRGTSTGVETAMGWNFIHTITAPVGAVVFAQFAVGDTLSTYGGYSAGTYYLLSTRETLPYIICQADPVVPDSAWGLQLFNSAGTRVYDTAMQTVEILGAGHTTTGALASGISIPSGANYAFCCCGGGGVVSSSQTVPPTFFYQTAIYTGGIRRTGATTAAYGNCIISETLSPTPISTPISTTAPMSYILIAA